MSGIGEDAVAIYQWETVDRGPISHSVTRAIWMSALT